MKTFPTISDDLLQQSYAVGNGELFWPLSAAAEAAAALASAGLGICGGEVYVSQGRAWGNMDLEWATQPDWRPDEPWSGYVERGLAQARSAMAQAQETLLHRTADAEREPMCFFAFYGEADYPRH